MTKENAGHPTQGPQDALAEMPSERGLPKVPRWNWVSSCAVGAVDASLVELVELSEKNRFHGEH